MIKEKVRRIFKCLRCGWEWPSYQARPRACGSCKSMYWDVPRKKGQK
jgi:predicted Zn-ribbon and HTH transcriptional regulator